MQLDNEDISKLDYQAKIEWYKKRVYQLSSGEITLQDYVEQNKDDIEAQDHTPDELIAILNDLSSKASKMEDKIAFLSAALSIPIDIAKTPEVAAAVKIIDPQSGGAYLSYVTYDKILRQQESVNRSISLDGLINGSTGDAQADSLHINHLIATGYASFSGQASPDGGATDQSVISSILALGDVSSTVNQIIDYADTWLSMNNEPKYIAWSFRKDVGEENGECKNLAEMWGHYSQAVTGGINSFVDGVDSLTALRPDQITKDLTTRYIKYTNNFLDRLNNTIDLRWAANLICCFLQWGIKLDMKTLKAIRTILKLMQINISISFQDILKTIIDTLKNIIYGAIMSKLMGLINQIIQRIVDPIYKWIGDPHSDIWKKIFECTPIAQMIQVFIRQAVIDIKAKLYDLLSSWFKKIEIQNIKNCLKLEMKTNQMWIGELLKLLDNIISVLEAAAACGMGNAPAGDLASTVASDLNLGDSTVYTFPKDPKENKYNSYQPTSPIGSSEGSQSAPGSDNNPLNSFNTVSGTMKLSTCLQRIPSDLVFSVQDWMIEPKTNV
jgi:hypothetical protein